MNTRKAFTLIELLIVVAIIAILAAIAVPNFLEAQVRSKVSRMKSDMRSVTTALEAYYTDNNRYPTMRANPAGRRPVAGDTSANETLGLELSTPIAYLTSMDITKDIFKLERKNPPLPVGRERLHYRNYQQIVLENPAFAAPSAGGRRIDADGAWRLASAGPDRYIFWDGGTPVQDFQNFQVITYDPTNGTISTGDIFRTQKVGDGARIDPLP